MRTLDRRLILLVCTVTVTTYAQWDARGVALPGTRGVSDTTVRIQSGNPSASAIRSSGEIALGFVPAPFGLSQLRRIGFSMVVPMAGLGAGLHVTTYGTDLFSREEVALEISTKISGSSAVGISAGGSLWRARGYAPMWNWTFGGGILWFEGVTSIGSVFKVELVPPGRMQPTLAVGMSVQAASGLVLAGELEHNRYSDLSAGYSIAYRVIESLEVIAGWREDPQTAGAGVSVRVSGYEVSIGANWHSVLGWTQGLGAGVKL